MPRKAPTFLILGNPGSPRLHGFQAALGRCGLPLARLLAWRDLLAGRDRLERHLAPQTVLRIDSPGRDFAVERLLIARGDRGGEGDLPASAALALEEDPGRLRHAGQWLRGFNRVCRDLAEVLAAHPLVRAMGAPLELAQMFDKPYCHALCQAQGVKVAPSLGAIGGYDALRQAMKQQGIHRVFVKLNGGSSGAGVLAYEAGHGGREQMTAALEVVESAAGPLLYNNRQIRRYRDHRTIRSVVDALARDGVHVERWVPKPGFDGHVWDLRVLAIAGRARHRIARLSRHPITNLHLLNRRERVENLGLDAGAIASIEHAVTRTAALFPNCLHVGVDLILPSGSTTPVVLEANAFGDLLPGLEHEGEAVYEAEIAAMLKWRSAA